MQELFIYLLKSSGLIAVFYLSYYFLVQKETFFNSNRWFLLSGLFTSVLIPIFFIEKIIKIEKSVILKDKISNSETIIPIVTQEILDWNLFIITFYILITLGFVLLIIRNLVSLYNLLKDKKIQINEQYLLVDIKEYINPFSFFKYIVFNSSLYSETELNNILKHEKVHSREKHAIDVLIAKVFCAIFWFNPFIWLYKKAILQNLEFIADQKAIENSKDKKAYQMTLLKVVSDQNCLSITNNFNQSLIKKRIVMLNKNQSQKRNSWKYATIIPVLVAFVIFFQVKVIAQEYNPNLENGNFEVTDVIFHKNASDEELKKNCEFLKKNANVYLKVSKIKRNSKGEITSISISANDNKGSKSNHDITGDEPISDFIFTTKRDKNGKREFGFFDIETKGLNDKQAVAIPISEEEFAQSLSLFDDMPLPPSPPDAPIMDNFPSPPQAPNFPSPPKLKAPKNPND